MKFKKSGLKSPNGEISGTKSGGKEPPQLTGVNAKAVKREYGAGRDQVPESQKPNQRRN